MLSPATAKDGAAAGQARNPGKAQQYYQRGLAEAQSHQNAAAIADFEQSITLDPDRFETYQALDNALSNEREWATIVQYWSQYIQLHPNDGRADCERGGAYSQLHDAPHTLADAEKACSLGIQKCCQVAANYRRAHGNAVPPPAAEKRKALAGSQTPGAQAAPATVAKKPWWRNTALLGTLGVGAVFVIPIVLLVIYWIRSAEREPQTSAPAPSSPATATSVARPAGNSAAFPGRAPPVSPGYSGMEATFTPTFDDLWKLRKHTFKKKTLMYIGFCFLGAFGTAYCIHASLPANRYDLPLGFLIAGLLLPLEDKRKAKAWAANNPDYFSQTSVSIGPEGFRVKSRAEDTSLQWNRVRDIVENKPYVYFRLTGSAASIVPQRAFRSPDEAQRFLDSATAYWQSARMKPQSGLASPEGAVSARAPFPAPSAQPFAAPSAQPWSPTAGAVVAAFFTPMAGGIVAYLSLKRMGYPRKAVWTLLLTIVGTTALCGLIIWGPKLPQGNLVGWGIDALVGYIFFAVQKDEWNAWRAAHRSLKLRSGWSALGWGLVGMAGFLGVIFIMLGLKPK
jgi:hypothetical protein